MMWVTFDLRKKPEALIQILMIDGLFQTMDDRSIGEL
jgi:hypothetical protein